MAYLVVLVEAYRRTQIIARHKPGQHDTDLSVRKIGSAAATQDNENPLPWLLYKNIDTEIRAHISLTCDELSKLSKEST